MPKQRAGQVKHVLEPQQVLLHPFPKLFGSLLNVLEPFVVVAENWVVLLILPSKYRVEDALVEAHCLFLGRMPVHLFQTRKHARCLFLLLLISIHELFLSRHLVDRRSNTFHVFFRRQHRRMVAVLRWRRLFQLTKKQRVFEHTLHGFDEKGLEVPTAGALCDGAMARRNQLLVLWDFAVRVQHLLRPGPVGTKVNVICAEFAEVGLEDSADFLVLGCSGLLEVSVEFLGDGDERGKIAKHGRRVQTLWRVVHIALQAHFHVLEKLSLGLNKLRHHLATFLKVLEISLGVFQFGIVAKQRHKRLPLRLELANGSLSGFGLFLGLSHLLLNLAHVDTPGTAGGLGESDKFVCGNLTFLLNLQRFLHLFQLGVQCLELFQLSNGRIHGGFCVLCFVRAVIAASHLLPPCLALLMLGLECCNGVVTFLQRRLHLLPLGRICISKHLSMEIKASCQNRGLKRVWSSSVGYEQPEQVITCKQFSRETQCWKKAAQKKEVKRSQKQKAD
eukprot:m.84082 g.84082  ORF g.84082 m.84082 type:complete len:503 (-) comp14787_c0_seq2:1147-2655(-)